jgi:DNA-directed RNA polymerase subunit L
MEVKILNDDKDSIEVEIDSLTIAEILRVYLNKDSNVSFAAWKRVHPTKNPILRVEGKNPKKSLKDASSAVAKDLDKIEKDFSKIK